MNIAQVPEDLHPGLLSIIHHSNAGVKELASKMSEALYPSGNAMDVDSASGSSSLSTIAAQHEKLTAASLRAFLMQVGIPLHIRALNANELHHLSMYR